MFFNTTLSLLVVEVVSLSVCQASMGRVLRNRCLSGVDVLHLPPVRDPTLDDARAAFALETVVAPRSQRARIILLVEVLRVECAPSTSTSRSCAVAALTSSVCEFLAAGC